MSKLKVFTLIAALAMLFTACDKEEEFSILGTWDMDKMVQKITEGDDSMEFTINNPGTVTFNSDGTGVNWEQQEFDWEISGKILTIYPEGSLEESMEWTLTTAANSKIVAEMSETNGGVLYEMTIYMSR
jgi:hypothetical protein